MKRDVQGDLTVWESLESVLDVQPNRLRDLDNRCITIPFHTVVRLRVNHRKVTTKGLTTFHLQHHLLHVQIKEKSMED